MQTARAKIKSTSLGLFIFAYLQFAEVIIATIRW